MYSNKQRVLVTFFDDLNPEGGLRLREISKKIKLAPTSVKKYLKELEDEDLILSKKHRYFDYSTYYPNLSRQFKFLKTQHTLKIIKNSGLEDYIYNNCLPDNIILFGSASIGEDSVDSDIDIFVQSSEKTLFLKKFEKILNRKINVFFHDSFEDLSVELKNNLVNGIILKGYLHAFTKKDISEQRKS